MVHLNPVLIKLPWFQIKLVCVLLTSISTLYAGQLVRKVQSGETLPTGKALRFLNEVPTLLMIIIVIMVIVRPW